MEKAKSNLPPLNILVGIVALVAPAVHSLTDLMEWQQGGFSTIQLWLNYIAFLPMPWLLLGIYTVQRPRPGVLGLAGAVIYGFAFTYFSHTTLYALQEGVATYEELWSRLGYVYTIHGGFMVVGGLMFAWSSFQTGWLPKSALLLFAFGVSCNLILALTAAPDITQTIGSSVRNLGLMFMGYGILAKLWRAEA